jgi:hypothetical protein
LLSHTPLAAITTDLVRWLNRLMPSGTRADGLIRTPAGTFGDAPQPVTAEECACAHASNP